MKYTTYPYRSWANIVFAMLFLFNSNLSHADNTSGGRAVLSALNTQWNKAFNNGKPGAIAMLYDENAILSPGNGEVLTGRDEIENLFRSFIENGVHDHSIEIIKVHRDGNILYQVSRWSASGVEENGTKPVFGGILVNIFHRKPDGEWKSHLHIWNVSN